MGGGGHGGHGGGGHHGGGGGWGRGAPLPYVVGYPEWGYTDIEPLVVERCPQVYAPVLGSDGRVYSNACYAQMRGVSIVRSVKRGVFGDAAVIPNPPPPAPPQPQWLRMTIGVASGQSPWGYAPHAAAAGAYLLYRHLKKKGG